MGIDRNNLRPELTRRATIHMLMVGALMTTAAMTRPENDEEPVSVTRATQFIQQSGDRLMAILNAPDDPLARRGQLEALIKDAIDVGGIARFTLGRLWTSASEDQRTEYVRLFPAVLLVNVGKAFGSYRGVRFNVDRATWTDSGVEVATTLLRPDYSMQVTWIVGLIGGTTKIVDIVAGGFSMRLSQRDDCMKLLGRDNNSIGNLIDTLRRQAAVLS